MTRCSAALSWRLPAWSSRWRCVLAALAGIGATPATRASFAGVAKAPRAGDLADEVGGDQRPEAGFAEQLRRDVLDERGDLALELVDGLGELAPAAQHVARDAHAHRLLGACHTAADPRRALLREQRAAGQRQLRPEVMQMPEQRAVELNPVADEAFAMIDQQPQVEFGPVEVRGGQRVPACPHNGAGEVERVDRVALPPWRARFRSLAVRCAGIRSTRSPRSINQRSSEPDTRRPSSSAQTSSSSSPRPQRRSASTPPPPTPTVRSPSHPPVVAATAAIVCDRL